MKKILSVVLALTLSVSLTPSFHAAGESAAAIFQGRILHMEGDVQVKVSGEEGWKTPQNGTWIPKGSEIKTGPGSVCDIGLGEGRSSVVQMREDTRTRLEILGAEKIRVGLEEGNVFVRVKDLKKGSTFEVASPAAVATARGTGWEQSVNEINVFESIVEVNGPEGETIFVEEGFGLEIDREGGLKEPEELPAEQKAEWENFEVQAEKHVAEEASLPEDPGFADAPAAREPSAASDEERPGTAPPDGDFPGPQDPDRMEEPAGSDTPDMPGIPEDGFPDPGENAPDMMQEPLENPFDTFDTGPFEPPMGTDDPNRDMTEALTQTSEEQHETLPPPSFDPNNPPPHCPSGSPSCS